MHQANTQQKTQRSIFKSCRNKMIKFSSTASFFLLISLLVTNCFSMDAQKCRPNGRVIGKKSPPRHCNLEEDDICCIPGKTYKTYKCSPPVSSHTKAHLTLASFESGGDGYQPSRCDNQYHSDDTPIVALSSGWFNNKSRCHNNITIRGNGRSVVAMVVDECDSTVGCDADHGYLPPCANNVVVASKAVWKALHVPIEEWDGLDITWSDA